MIHLTRREFLANASALGAAGALPLTLLSRPALAQPQKGGRLRFGIGHGSTSDSLDPATFINGYTLLIGFGFRNHLTEVNNTGELIGELAESWEASPGAKTWTFKLRRGGNADFPYLMSDYHLAIMPATGEGADWQSGMGTGGYVLESFEPGVRTFMKRFPNYWKEGRAHADEVEVLSIINVNARQNALFAGAVDAAVLYKEHAAAGIDINVVREPNDGYWSNVWMKKAWCACYWGGRPTEDWMFSTAYEAGAEWNDTFWNHERFNKLLIEARSELDANRRAELYSEMQRIVSDEGGVVVPMFANYVFGLSDRVQHAEMAANWDLDGDKAIERWWLAS